MIPLAESDNRINQATQEWNYQECSKKHPLFCNQLVRSSSHTYRVDLLWCTSRMKWKPQTENSIITILLHSIQSASDKKSGNMRKKCRSGEVPPKKRERRALRTLPPNAKRNLVYSRERLSLHPSLRETQQIGRQMSGLQVTCQVTCSVLQHRKLWNLRISERFGYLYLWISLDQKRCRSWHCWAPCEARAWHQQYKSSPCYVHMIHMLVSQMLTPTFRITNNALHRFYRVT